MKSLVVILMLTFPGCRTFFNHKVPDPKEVRINPKTDIKIQGSIVRDYTRVIPGKQTPFYDTVHMIMVKINKGEKNINLLIGSTGGEVSAAMEIVGVMKAAQKQGIKFRCFVGKKAMSAAVYIYTQCDERYAFKFSKIMFHSARYGMGLEMLGLNSGTVKKTRQAIIDQFNEELWNDTKPYFSSEFWKEHFKKETVLSASIVKEESPAYLHIIEDPSEFIEDF